MRVGVCLYRYVPNGRYYAFIRHQGKLIKKSLKTDYLKETRRLLRDERDEIERVDSKAGSDGSSRFVRPVS